MSLAPGTRIGPYEITSPLGEGGMGVVFRARDTQLLRDVAVKLLPGRFANDAERLGRFQREAQVLASLNHPNIAQIYGFQQTGASGAIVMELVEGDTLDERLKRGPLPVDQAILIARQIVDALEAAHKRNIIHRDLKPANIKLTPDGKVKVLDFGLAKALADEDPRADLSNSPTVMSGSVAGVIMGTAAYMSPEQARGADVDARTDIWAFGCVLYELLTSKPAFTGATATDIIAKIIESQPNWSLLPPETPFLMRTLLSSTLTKDRSERLQHIDDARVFLKAGEIPAPSVAPMAQARRGRVITAALIAALLAALWPATLYFLRAPEQQPEIRFEIPVQGTLQGGLPNIPAISPDGQRIAYAAQMESKTTIWVRPLGEVRARPLAGTENGSSPFWSPDSRYIAFFADGKLKKINVGGGPATTLADSALAVTGAWNRDGVILFSVVQSAAPAIVRVSESGGAVTPVVPHRDGVGDFFPQFLPDGRHFLYASLGQGTDADLYAGSLDGGAPVHIMSIGAINDLGNFPGRYAAPGYLLFVRGKVLLAQRFDEKRLALTGEPVTVAEPAGPFSVSGQQTLVYQRVDAQSPVALGNQQLLWIDRTGKRGPSVGMLGTFGTLRLSPDGHHLALDQTIGTNTDVWVIDLDRGVPNRLTFDPLPDADARWSPDGKRIVFTSSRAGAPEMFLRSSISIGADELLPSETPPNMQEISDDWSSDGKYIIFVRAPLNGGYSDIWLKPMFGDGKPFPFAQSKSFVYGEPRVAPNNRWLAYTTNESGTYQIVVQTFPDPTGGKSQVTARGGLYPTWRADGRELYYVALDGKLMAVPVKDGERFDFGEPVVLFQTPLTIPSPPRAHLYDASADGKRFLFIANSNAVTTVPTDSAPITAIVNWTAVLQRK